MTWKCPACQTTLRHDGDGLGLPKVGMIYRCHICRLELTVDQSEPDKLTLAPMPSDKSAV
jgi:hypothetical protein